MSKQKQAAETKTERTARPKIEPAPAPELGPEEVALPELAGGPAAAPGDGRGGADPFGQAARLADSRFQAVQRQALAARIGATQGNHHLQMALRSLQRGGNGHGGNGHGAAPGVAGTAELGAEEGLGSGGSPSLSPGEPPRNGNGNGHGNGWHGHGLAAPVQRQEEEEAEDTPTEEEKQAALAAARAAQAQAGQAKDESRSEVSKARADKAQEAQVKQAAKQKQAEAAAKGGPAPAAAEGQAEGKGGPPAPEAGKAAPGGNGKGPVAGLAPAPAGLAPAAAPEAAPADGDRAPASAEEDPAFQGVVTRVRSVGAREGSHAPAKAKAAEAQAAAVPPPSEVESKAQAGQVDKMEKAETPAFDKAAFKAKLMQRIEASAPKTAEEADSFKEQNKLGGMKGDMQGEVGQQQAATTGPLEEQKDAPPDSSGIEPKPVTPLEPPQPGAAPPPVGAEGAVPKPKGRGELETPLEQDSASLDQKMAEADVTEEQLANSNEPSFVAAADSKKQAQAHAKTAPAEVRQEEAGQIAQGKAEATAAAEQKTQAMHGDRANLLTQVAGKQAQSKSQDEKKRQEVSAKIRGIYDTTKADVERILAQMDQEVGQAFDAGAEAAMKAFNDYIDRATEAHKQERYGGWFGWARWLKDKFKSDPEIDRIADRGKALFLEQMQAVVDNVVEIIARGITQAKARIATGKQEIKTYVESLPRDLKQVGQEAAGEVQSSFDELETSVNDKQDELIDSLAQKYSEKLEAVNSRVEAIKEANKGLIDRAVDAIAGAIRTIIELKNMLLNVLAKVASVIGGIIRDPIGFLGNLLSGIKLGFNNFVANIGTHLKKGLIAWLTGSIAGAGIKLPENFDLPGIFQLVLQILGLSFEQIMKRVADLLGFDIRAFIAPIVEIIDIYKKEGMAGLAKHGLARLLGQERVDALLKVWDLIQVVIGGNFSKLWELVQGHLSGLKEMVMGKIESFLAERVIKAGVVWLLSLFNPVGAFIKACKMIYDVVMFFVENGRQIMALVNAIIDSVGNIVAGNISGAAKYIEETLARGIPIAISFMARLLGLGNVSEKVQEIIQAARGLVEKALDAIFNSGPVKMVAGFIKKVVGKVKGLVAAGVNKVKGLAVAGVNKVKGWAKSGTAKVKGALGIGKEKKEEKKEEKKGEEAGLEDAEIGESQSISDGTATHRLWVEKSGVKAVLMLASEKTALRTFLDGPRVKKWAGEDPKFAAKVERVRSAMDSANEDIDQILDAVRTNDDAKLENKDASLEKRMKAIAVDLKDILVRLNNSRKPASINRVLAESNTEQIIQPGQSQLSGDQLLAKLSAISQALVSEDRSNTLIRNMRKEWHLEGAGGAIYAPFLEDHAEAISKLAPELEGEEGVKESKSKYLISLERGGALLGSQLAERANVEHIRIKKVSDKSELEALGHQGHHAQQRADVEAKIIELMEREPQDQIVTISVAETAVSGASIGGLVPTLRALTRRYPNLDIRFLILQQTMQLAKDKDASRLAESNQGKVRAIAKGGHIQVTIQSTSYILGEDVDYQAAPDSKRSLIVFKGTGAELMAYELRPEGETTARDVLIDLVQGAYSGLLPGIL